MQQALGMRPFVRIGKIRLHRPDPLIVGHDRRKARGNDVADKYAQLAASANSRQGAAAMIAAGEQVSLVVRSAGHILAAWPAPK